MTKNAYEQAGVNIAAGEEIIEGLKQAIGEQGPHILNGIGNFAGCYQLSEDRSDSNHR